MFICQFLIHFNFETFMKISIRLQLLPQITILHKVHKVVFQNLNEIFSSKWASFILLFFFFFAEFWKENNHILMKKL